MKSTLTKFVSLSTALLSAFMLLGNTMATTQTERRYDGKAGVITRATPEYIDYASSTIEQINTPNNVPYYFPTSGFENACGAAAGSIVVGYYDKYFQDLMPNYTNYYTASGKYRIMDSTHVPAMMQSLYTLMQTNVVAPGVSEAECLDGLEAYIENAGYTPTYTSVKSTSSTFNLTAYKNAINNQQPVLLFCNEVELLYLDLNQSTQDSVEVAQTSTDHIMVGYGYLKVEYYDANNVLFRTDEYLRVASGWSINEYGFVKIGDTSWLDSAYAVDVT